MLIIFLVSVSVAVGLLWIFAPIQKNEIEPKLTTNQAVLSKSSRPNHQAQEVPSGPTSRHPLRVFSISDTMSSIVGSYVPQTKIFIVAEQELQLPISSIEFRNISSGYVEETYLKNNEVNKKG